jgi:hypothetical protein
VIVLNFFDELKRRNPNALSLSSGSRVFDEPEVSVVSKKSGVSQLDEDIESMYSYNGASPIAGAVMRVSRTNRIVPPLWQNRRKRRQDSPRLFFIVSEADTACPGASQVCPRSRFSRPPDSISHRQSISCSKRPSENHFASSELKTVPSGMITFTTVLRSR